MYRDDNRLFYLCAIPYRGAIQGSGGLIKTGDGVQTFERVTKSYTGETIVERGTLSVSSPGQMTNTSSITVHEGDPENPAELFLSSEFGWYDFGWAPITLDGGGLGNDSDSETVLESDITLASDARIYSRGSLGQFYLFGNLSGPGMMRKVGSGELILAGWGNTATGGTSIGNGTLTVEPGTSLSSGPLLFDQPQELRTLNLHGPQQVSLLDGTSDEEFVTGLIALHVAGATLTVDQAFADDPEDEGVELTTRFQGGITGAGSFVKTGDGYLAFTRHPKTYTGSTTINEGVLAVSAVGLPTGTSGIQINPGGQLRLTSQNDDDGARTYTFGGDLVINGLGRNLGEEEGYGRLGVIRQDPGGSGEVHQAVITNNIHFAGDSGIHVNGATKELELSGSLSGPGDLVRTGGGLLVLSGDNGSYAGGTVISNGVTQVNAGSSLGDGPLVFDAPGADRTLRLFNASQTVAALSGEVAGAGSAILHLGSGHTLTVAQDDDTAFEGQIIGDGGLIKSGAGTLALAGHNSYAGPTQVSGGRLNVVGLLSVASDVSVGSGATLGGTGTVGGDVQLNDGAALAPGTSTGTLTVEGNVNVPAGAALEIELATVATYDRLSSDGTVSLGGTLAVSLLGGFIPSPGQVFEIVTAGQVSGTFANLDGLGRVETLGGEGTFLVTVAMDKVTLSQFSSTTPFIPGDFDGDGDVDDDDLAIFAACFTGPAVPYDPGNLPAGCTLAPDVDGIIAADFTRDGSVDQSDFGIFQRCLSGECEPGDPSCAD